MTFYEGQYKHVRVERCSHRNRLRVVKKVGGTILLHSISSPEVADRAAREFDSDFEAETFGARWRARLSRLVPWASRFRETGG